MVHKWWRVGVVYLTGVVAGSLAASISDPFSYLAGASGGVYALISAHLASVVIVSIHTFICLYLSSIKIVLFNKNWKQMEFNWIRLIGLLVFGGTDIGVAIYGRYVQNESNRTSYSAHIAGALAGFLIGVNVLRNLKAQRWEVILGWFVFISYINQFLESVPSRALFF